MENNWKSKAAKYAYDDAPGTYAECAKYVRKAIQKARKQKDEGWNKDAKDCGSQLQKRDYAQSVDNGNYNNGDVIIWHAVRQHKHGHIQIYYDGTWVSDHHQNQKNPWKDRQGTDKCTLYR